MSVPLISAVKRSARKFGTVILDAPPGTACPLAETVDGSDYVILATEPTPFGLHDLEITVKVVSQIGVPHGVIINFASTGDKRVNSYCEKMKIPILMEIPFDKRIAELYSRGISFTEEMPEWKEKLRALLDSINNNFREGRGRCL